ncbi:MAG: creatininase family protein [Chloroflexi bacterium]|nr:creatininase family protein [Chloroflexota bacterium]
MKPIILQDLIDAEAREAFARKDKWVILPLGSTEFHGPRGPYGTDHYVAWEIAKRVSAATGALLLPPLPYGFSPDHMGYPGTIHLEYETMRRVLGDIIASLHRHGVAKLLILLGHWGNYEVALETRETSRAMHPGLRIEVLRVFDDAVLGTEHLETVFGGRSSHGHGGAREVSGALYARPHLIPPAPAQVAQEYPPPEKRSYRELGWSGLPEEASAERGAKVIEITAEGIVRYLQNIGETGCHTNPHH